MSAAKGSLTQRLGPNATRVAVVAALVLASILILIVVAATKGDTYELRAEFENVRGLLPGGEVRAGAIAVGSVKDVYLNEEDEPEVLMQIDGDYTVHEGAVANIRLGSNVGAVNRTIDLTQGDTSAPALSDGAFFPGEETDQPVDFDLAIETLNPETRAHIKDFLIGLRNSVAGRGDDFDAALQHSSNAFNETANLFAQVNSDGEALRTLVAEGERVVSALASSPEDLGQATERTATLLRTTANRQSELAESVRLLGPALARGRVTLERLAGAAPEARRLVEGLRPVVDELGPFAGALPPTARAAGPFLAETAKLVEQGPQLLTQLRPVVAEALPASKALVPTVNALLPLADVLRAYAPETIGFFQNFGSTVGAYDATGHLIRTLGGIHPFLPPSTAAAGAIEADNCGPGLLKPPYIRVPGVNECQPWTDYDQSFFGGGN